MKKLILTSALVAVVGLTQATTVSLTSASAMFSGTSGNLEGNDAYAWGISIGTDSTLTSFELDFTGTKLTASGNNTPNTGVLYADLLNSTTLNQSSPNYTIATDNDASGDYWQGATAGSVSSAAKTTYGVTALTVLGSKNFTLNQTQSWTNTPDLSVLNSYLSADKGIINIGLDPDCYFAPGTISVTYTVSPTSKTVPDNATTALLMVLGLACLEIFRRQSVLAKSKA